MELSNNLAPVRGPSVWSREDFSGRPYGTRQMLVAAAGFGLLTAALSGRSRHRVLVALGGASLLALAAPRHCVADARDWIRHQVDAWRGPDAVNEASESSFPASDSPSWTSTVGSGAEERGSRG